MSIVDQSKAFELRTEDGKGFWITFANGYTVSVQFAKPPHSYSDGGKTTAEVAVIEPDGRTLVHLREHDDVIGHATPEKVAELMFEYSMKEVTNES